MTSYINNSHFGIWYIGLLLRGKNGSDHPTAAFQGVEPTNRRDRGSRTTGFPADDGLIMNLAVPGEAYREDVTFHFMTIELHAFTSTPDRIVAAAVQKAAHIKLRKNGSNEGSRRTVGLRRIESSAL